MLGEPLGGGSASRRRFQTALEKGIAELEAKCDPARQAVFGDLFDAGLDPANPKGTVGIVCEAVGFRGGGVQSNVGRIVSGACGRTLRDRGWAVKGISLRSLKPGALSVAETPVVIVAFGNDAPAREQADALIAFRKAGGRLIYISGQFCTASHDRIASGRPLVLGNGDPLDISGMADALADRRARAARHPPPRRICREGRRYA